MLQQSPLLPNHLMYYFPLVFSWWYPVHINCSSWSIDLYLLSKKISMEADKKLESSLSSLNINNTAPDKCWPMLFIHTDPLPVMTDATTKEYIRSLRTPPSTYSSHIRYTLYEFPELLDSSSISSAGWTQIATTIQNNYFLFDGFVILHGTDSLAYTSSALSFMCAHLGKPVILTGSQASIFALQSDAVDNLLGALIIAGTFMIPEVCLFFHHNLFRGNRTTVSNLRLPK